MTSILNILKACLVKHLLKQKQYIFVFHKCLTNRALKKINMAARVKIGSFFQNIQNTLSEKSTLKHTPFNKNPKKLTN